MKYDFTTILDRRGKDALAVDAIGPQGWFGNGGPAEGFDIIPMWVADMNFPAFPNIQKAMIERIGHPTYGYFEPRDEYYNAIIEWQLKRNGVTGLEKVNIGYENGVLGGVVSALNVFCSKGDNVLVNSPTYIGFTEALENNGYNIVHSPLVKDDNGVWRMDYADMEQKIKDKSIHAAIFCSPHNPCGRVWDEKEIATAMQLFEKYEVDVISDEIWSDIILGDAKHIPTQSVSEYARQHTVAMYAPSKTFNLAGLIGSYHIVYNRKLHERLLKESSLSHYNSMNLMSQYALMGAYCEEGMKWVGELCEVLAGNVDFALDYIQKNFEDIFVARPQGTYMLFLDCTEWCKKHNTSLDDLINACWRAGVMIQDGRPFHGSCHIRMNLALPLSRVKEAFDRLSKYVFAD